MWATSSYNSTPHSVIDIQATTEGFSYGKRLHMYDISATYMGIFTANYHSSSNYSYFNPDIAPTITGGEIISYEYSNNADVCTVIFTVNNRTSTIINFGVEVFGSYCDPCMVFKLN